MQGFRARMQDGGPMIGHLVMEFATPGIGHLLANAGCDFAALDMEHSGLGLETIRALIRYCEAAGLPALVRPPSSDPALVAQVLDAGAQGVMLPMVETAAQAARLAAAARFAPAGRRGVAAGIARDRYRRPRGPLSQALAQANAEVLVLPIIESAEGPANAEAIAATPGVDGLIVGHGDLSVSLGLADDPRGAAMTAAEARIAAAARANGLLLAGVCGDAAQGAAMRAAGFAALILGADAATYQGALTTGVDALRRALA